MTILRAAAMDHLNLFVRDLDESLAFYQQMFGFELRKDQPEDHSKIIGNDAIKLCMYQNPKGVKDGGINHFGFYVENFEDVVATCEALGVKMTYGVVDWGESRSVYITDPNGYEIELSEKLGGGL